MIIEGKASKKDKLWLVDIPLLDLMTQAKSEKDIIAMAKDVVECLFDNDEFEVEVTKNGSRLLFKANDTKALMAMTLKRQRARKMLTLADVADAMGSKSINRYAQYEQGKHQPSLDIFEQLLMAIDSTRVPVMRYEKA